MRKGELKDAVEAVLKVSEASRNDDTKLVLNVWHKVRPDLFAQLDLADVFPAAQNPERRTELFIQASNILKLPPAEGITRIRRKFQEQGMYEATDPAVRERRRREQKAWVGFARTGEFQS